MIRLKPAFHRFGSDILRELFAKFSSELDGLQDRITLEGVHRLRVVSRRLRNGLQLFAAAFPEDQVPNWRKEIRWLARTIGRIRDLDVQARFLRKHLVRRAGPKAKPGIKRLLSHLQYQRRALAPELKEVLEKFKHSPGFLIMRPILNQPGGLEIHGPKLGAAQLRGKIVPLIQRRCREFLTFAPVLKNPDDGHQLHQMRIAAKHLRYTLELFSPACHDRLTASAKLTARFQAYLGRIHDADVWLQALDSFSIDLREQTAATPAGGRQWRTFQPGLEYLRRQLHRTRKKNIRLLLNHWERCCKGGDSPFRHLARHGRPR